jgi:ketosteroid isomerase-like protein
MEVENLIAEGPFVAAQIAVQATAAGGDPYRNYYHQLFECHDGKITAQWEYLDTLYASRVLNRSL